MLFSGFRGGIHPKDCKEMTAKMPIEALALCDSYTFILSQGGKGTAAVVKKGDIVKRGQLIADSTEFLSAPIHSSVSGVVEKITRAASPKGGEAEAVVIKNDFTDDTAEPGEHYPEGYVSREKLIELTRRAGVVGMGGAGFPAHVKMATDKKINTVIINAAECEPYLTSDYRILAEEPEDMTDGLDLMLHAFGINNGVIALEDNKKDIAEELSKKLKPGIKIRMLKTKYPQGSEKQLIKSVLGREVPEGGLPADVGALVFNVDTAASVSRAVRRAEPVTQRVVTVSGSAVKRPSNFRVRIGTPLSFVLESAGGFASPPSKIIVGGPMMGQSQYDTKAPVMKTTSGILALTGEELGTKAEGKCIRCGACVSACPMGLMPLTLSALVKAKKLDEAKKYGIMSCIECGCCAYTCPSDRNPVAAIRQGKQQLRNGR